MHIGIKMGCMPTIRDHLPLNTVKLVGVLRANTSWTQATHLDNFSGNGFAAGVIIFTVLIFCTDKHVPVSEKGSQDCGEALTCTAA
jgi:hypothetical protein